MRLGARAYVDAFAAAGLACALDRAFGEPPARLHPVVGLGRLIGTLETRAPGRAQARFVYGAGLAAAVTAAAVLPAWLIGRAAARLPWPLRVVVVAAALKPAFAWRALDEQARRVLTPLEAGDLMTARRALATLVSRPTANLDAPLVAAAAIESVAENASDSVVAPLYWFAVGGLPAAWLYRAVNTMDAMIGYRTARYEWLGKPAARLDDALNWIPARLAVLLLVLAAPVAGGSVAGAWRILRRDGGATASPNAGRPMAAMAGALGVELEKVGHYRLGAGLRLPMPADLHRALRLLDVVAPAALAPCLPVRSLLAALRWSASRRRWRT